MQISFHPARSAVQPAPVTTPQPPAATSMASFAHALAQASGNVSEPAANPAPLARKLTGSIFGDAAADGIITGDEMRAARDEAKAEYQRRFSAAIAAQAIDTSVPLSLQSDAMGRVVVVGDHPDKARIEQLFAEDGELNNAFKKASSLARMVAAFEEALPFHAAYDKDPQAAVAQYSYLFNTTTQLTMEHRWGSEGLDVLFSSERVFRTAWI
jgi:hypothetical protein